MLKQIGNYINTCQLEQVIRTIDTDDTRNVISEAVDKIGYNDFANLYALLSPYNFDAIIAGPMAFVDIINIPEFKDATAGHDFHGTGNLVTPFGAKFLFSKSELLEKRILHLTNALRWKRFSLVKLLQTLTNLSTVKSKEQQLRLRQALTELLMKRAL